MIAKMYQFNLKNLIYLLLIVWLIQIDLVNANSTSSLNSSNHHKLNKSTKFKNLKPPKRTVKQKSKQINNSTSLSPVKLENAIENNVPKTLYQISRDGRHQMLAFGSEITLANQMQQLVFEQNLV